MAKANIREQERFYRRGVVLGLTMAEIMVLLLFVLLLVLASAMTHIKDDLEFKSKALTAVQKEKEELREKLARTLLILRDRENQPDPASLVEKLTLCEKREADLLQKLKKAEPIVIAVEAAFEKSELDLDKLDPDVIEEKLTEALFLYSAIKPDHLKKAPTEASDPLAQLKSLAKRINDLPVELPTQEHTSENTPTTLEECKGRLTTIQGQYAALQSRIETKGKGTEHPACWVDESGKVEFIADVKLTESGFIVEDRKLPHRVAEQARLPLEGVVWGAEVSVQKFLQMTRLLLDWSKRQNPECRFFVRIFDQTLPGHKLLYKQRERQVQQVFYTYEPEPDMSGVQ